MTPEWKTAEMLSAERAMDGAVEHAYRAMHEADDLLDEIAANEAVRAAEHAEECREYAHRSDVSPEWRAVIAKVEAGELTWQEISRGDAMDDPALQAAIVGDRELRGSGVYPEPEPEPDHRPDDDYYDDFTVYGGGGR